MQLDTKKHEVSQYLRSAHANRHAEARVSRCMNTRHAEGKVDVEVSSGAWVANPYWPVSSIYTQLPCSFSLIPKNIKMWVRERDRSRKRKQEIPSCYENFREFPRTEILREVPKDYPKVKESSFRVLISPGQYIQDIDVGFWELTSHYQNEDLEGIKGVPDIGDGFRARKVGPVYVSFCGSEA
ncbi:hypothetical protein F2Q68_00031029 [Brassica cretica]|uniref:Uncharacterized protein n=1 Tax=Brassica cretica TaxID=69181 RepID=A0A8S9GAY2_BRACR|nr:hypothetical protein F2Q68_00031029 [Brassica cretica]